MVILTALLARVLGPHWGHLWGSGVGVDSGPSCQKWDPLLFLENFLPEAVECFFVISFSVACRDYFCLYELLSVSYFKRQN